MSKYFAALCFLSFACAEAGDVDPSARAASLNADAGSGGGSGGQAGVDMNEVGGAGGSDLAGSAGDFVGGAGDVAGAAGVGPDSGASGTNEHDASTDATDAAKMMDATMMDATVVDVSCKAETNATFCSRLGKDCGTVSANDNCGAARMASCGACTSPKVCSGAGMQNVCGTPVSLATGGTVTSSNPGPFQDETMIKAFDGDPMTKWYPGDGVNTAWLAYQFANNTKHTVLSYVLTSANDVPGRDPSAWQLEGSNDGTTWTMVDARSGQTFAGRNTANPPYVCTQPGSYSHYRLSMTANNGGTELQLAELALFGY